MGCDIHCYCEIELEGQWHLYDQIKIERDYELFGAMAGVRRPEEMMFKVKGLPPDCSKVVRLESIRRGDDIHSHSWLSLKEIAKVLERFPRTGVACNDNYLFGHSYVYISERLEIGELDPTEFPSYVEDVRWVFWFDN
jgi:hypothetical protein